MSVGPPIPQTCLKACKIGTLALILRKPRHENIEYENHQPKHPSVRIHGIPAKMTMQDRENYVIPARCFRRYFRFAFRCYSLDVIPGQQGITDLYAFIDIPAGFHPDLARLTMIMASFPWLRTLRC